MIDLQIDYNWRIWTPKAGRHKGQEIYVCNITIPKDSRLDLSDVLISKIKNDKVYMHKGQITHYQKENNTRPLSPEEENNIPILEKKFVEYRQYWVDMRIKKKAKELLRG